MKNKNHVPIAVAPSRAARDFLLCLGAFFLFSLSLYLSVSLLVSDRVLRLILGPAPTSGSPWSTMAARYRGHNAAAIPLSLSEWRLNGPGSPPPGSHRFIILQLLPSLSLLLLRRRLYIVLCIIIIIIFVSSCFISFNGIARRNTRWTDRRASYAFTLHHVFHRVRPCGRDYFFSSVLTENMFLVHIKTTLKIYSRVQ